jgi:hypothetical protein
VQRLLERALPWENRLCLTMVAVEPAAQFGTEMIRWDAATIDDGLNEVVGGAASSRSWLHGRRTQGRLARLSRSSDQTLTVDGIGFGKPVVYSYRWTSASSDKR